MKSYIVFGIISFFVLLIGILIFTRKGSNKDTLNEEQGKNEKKKSDKVGKTVAELIPLADYDLWFPCIKPPMALINDHQKLRGIFKL